MTQYYECIVWKETKSGKKRPVKLGSARPRDGGGWFIDLDAIPAPVDGRYSFIVQEQKERAETAKPSNWDAPAQRGELDDSIPF